MNRIGTVNTAGNGNFSNRSANVRLLQDDISCRICRQVSESTELLRLESQLLVIKKSEGIQPGEEF